MQVRSNVVENVKANPRRLGSRLILSKRLIPCKRLPLVNHTLEATTKWCTAELLDRIQEKRKSGELEAAEVAVKGGADLTLA